MTRSKRTILLAAVGVLGVVVVALLAVSTATAAGNGAGAQTFTEHTHQEHVVDFDYLPCSDPPIPGRITQTINSVFHATELTSGNGAGTFWITGTATGKVLFEPIDSELVGGPDDTLVPEDPNWEVIPGGTTYSGRFTVWFGENQNLQNHNGTFTFGVTALGSDGSRLRFHETAHFLITPNGVEFEFDKTSC